MPRTAAKREPEMETQALDWMEGVLGTKLDREKEYPDMIKDGIELCNLMNKLVPGCIKKIDKKGGGFALMQNIERFNKAALAYGVPVRECFQTVDLWERKNIPAVTLCIHALGRIKRNMMEHSISGKVRGVHLEVPVSTQTKDDYTGPVLGPKMSETQHYDFTPEQLAEAKNAVSQQSGFNKGANQAGQSMGKQRMIYQD